jgi:protein CpxP
MLNNRKIKAGLLVLCCVAALTVITGIAQAGGGGWGYENFGDHQQQNFRKYANKLGLTDIQKAQAKAIFQGNKDILKPIITNLQAERKNLQSLIHADTVDEAAIRAQTVKLAGILADLNVNRARMGIQFRAILTPSQQAILKTLYEKNCNKKSDVNAAPTE